MGSNVDCLGYGYSSRIIKSNKAASARLIGVKLGRVCIKNETPVAEIADTFGVSRQTIYNWFAGTTEPSTTVASAIKDYLAKTSR